MLESQEIIGFQTPGLFLKLYWFENISLTSQQ